MTGLPPLAAQARECVNRGDWAGAIQRLKMLVEAITGLPVISLNINRDQYSLNSLNGSLVLDGGRSLFFKYHQEEGEDKTIQEYYNATLLREAGFAVDIPLYTSGEPGRQILLYALRSERRLADVCREIESQQAWQAMASVVEAQQSLDRQTLACVKTTLVPGCPELVKAEPIHQLFHHRLVSAGKPPGLGGRVEKFYIGKSFAIGDIELPWDTLKSLRWNINGVSYRDTLEELFLEAGERLSPIALAGHGVVIAHGDAHNANVWYTEPQGVPSLVSFDPAFAGRQIPALIAEIKATFHNIFAHPLWLYEPKEASQHYHVRVYREGGNLYIEHDWSLTPLRAEFFKSKSRYYWQPLLEALAQRGWLPDDWQRIVRLAMFCCPTLVLDLRAGGSGAQWPVSSALGFAIAMMLGSTPLEGDDLASRWLNEIAP